MAVLRCPDCGELFLVATDRCDRCGADLVSLDAPPLSDPPPRRRRDVGTAEHEAWELHAWTMEGRRLLDGMLTTIGIPHSWQGSTLLAPEVEHERVQDLVDEVAASDARVGADAGGSGDAGRDVRGSGDADPDDDRRDDIDADDSDADDSDAVDIHADDPDAAGQVGYDLTGWDDDARGQLIAALAEAEIPHDWDADGDLVVAAEDEGRTDAVFTQLDEQGIGSSDDDLTAGWGEADDDEDLLVQQVLSDLFIGADRLQRNPADTAAARQVIDARDSARTLRLPFGFERVQWQSILTSASELVDVLGPAPTGDGDATTAPDDDEVRDVAADLRTRLRDVV